MNLTVKISQAASIIESYIMAKLVPMLVGSPGCGKSAIVHQIAEKHNLKVIDLRLAQCDPTDINGFPTIVNNVASYVAMDTFPIKGRDEVPSGYNGWLLFLDEFTSASTAVQAASYKLVLDRMVGNHPLHDNVAIVCAGNLETDNAIVNTMSTALQSRLVHLELEVNHEEWIEWAAENDVDYRITSFIKFKPGLLYNFRPDHTDKTYACPRTWEFTNRLLKKLDPTDKMAIATLSGAITEGVAREFISFCKIANELPKLEEILKDPTGIKVPAEPSILFALTGAMAHNAKTENIDSLMKFINRLPIEFQVVCLKEAIRRTKPLLQSKPIQDWITTNAKDLFS